MNIEKWYDCLECSLNYALEFWFFFQRSYIGIVKDLLNFDILLLNLNEINLCVNFYSYCDRVQLVIYFQIYNSLIIIDFLILQIYQHMLLIIFIKILYFDSITIQFVFINLFFVPF